MFSMKRLLPLLIVAFLISCNNQSTEKAAVEESQQEPVLSMVEVEQDDQLEVLADQEAPGAVTIKVPDENTAQEKEAETKTAFLFNSGTTAYQNDDFENGVAFFEEIIAKEPDNKKAYYNLGIGYFKLGKYHEALQSFNNAIAIMPRDSMSIQYRGRVYYMMGNFRQCLLDYETVVKMSPNDPIAYYNRGTAKGQLKDYGGALKDFDRAIELDDQYAEAYFNRGLANFFLGKRHDACFDWRKAHSMGHYESEKAIRNHCEGI